jgi:hypothetical protein
MNMNLVLLMLVQEPPVGGMHAFSTCRPMKGVFFEALSIIPVFAGEFQDIAGIVPSQFVDSDPKSLSKPQ